MVDFITKRSLVPVVSRPLLAASNGKALGVELATKKVVGTKKEAKKPTRKSFAPAGAAHRQKPVARAPAKRSPGVPALFYRLHSLLGTVRSIAGYEDHLCTLLHDVQTHGMASPELTRDLLSILNEMPSPATYREEFEGVRRAPANPAPVAESRDKRSVKQDPRTAKRKRSSPRKG